MILISYPIEWYSMARAKFPALRRVLPPITGDIKHLKPAIFSICTHLFATNTTASRPVAEGGIGYKGIMTTLEGMTQEVIEWNAEHKDPSGPKKVYRSSVALAEEIQKLAALTSAAVVG